MKGGGGDGTGSGFSALAGFCVNGVENFNRTSRQFVC